MSFSCAFVQRYPSPIWSYTHLIFWLHNFLFSILITCVLIYCSFKGDFCTEKIIKKHNENGQVLNKPQMRLLLKISRGTFYQIQTDIYRIEKLLTKS